MFVSTKLSKMRRSSVFVPTPESYVRAAIATIGVESYTFGCMSHALQVRITEKPSFKLCLMLVELR